MRSVIDGWTVSGFVSGVVGHALFGVPWWQSLIIGFPIVVGAGYEASRATRTAKEAEG